MQSIGRHSILAGDGTTMADQKNDHILPPDPTYHHGLCERNHLGETLQHACLAVLSLDPKSERGCD